jgi:carboxymethylenebutenolidase
MERKQASDYPQEVLDLFHEYQHGDMSRRSFIEKLQKFAVGGVTAMAIYESLKPNYAWAQQVKTDDSRIKSSRETVASPDGNGKITGYFAHPASGSKFPGVIVIHENRGLNPYIEDVARRFAVAGYVAYAPDGLTSVGGYPGDDEQGAAKFREVNGPKMLEDFVASAKWLKANSLCTGRIGAVGFCFGGGIVNQLAVRLGGDLAAGAPFYGRQPSAEDTAKIQAPLMLHYADPAKDPGVGNGIAGFEEALKANHKVYEKYVYDGAQHGFHNDTTPRYDEAAAKLAWQRTLDWFNKYVKGGRT